MSWQQKSNLIKKDPVTCARNVDHMVQLFIHDVLRSDVMPIGDVAVSFGLKMHHNMVKVLKRRLLIL